MRPSTFHAPGLHSSTNAKISRILNAWRKNESQGGSKTKGKSKKK